MFEFWCIAALGSVVSLGNASLSHIGETGQTALSLSHVGQDPTMPLHFGPPTQPPHPEFCSTFIPGQETDQLLFCWSTGQIESNYDETVDSFDDMALKAELLRGGK